MKTHGAGSMPLRPKAYAALKHFPNGLAYVFPPSLPKPGSPSPSSA